jgi:hypothetical protein
MNAKVFTQGGPHMPVAKSAARKTEAPLPLEDVHLLQPGDMPRYDRLITEDDTPVDSIFAETQHRLLVDPLYLSWDGPPDYDGKFMALSNVGLFNTDLERKPPVVPDMLLCLGVSKPRGDRRKKENRSCYIWRMGKPPEAAIEVVSNAEGDEDTRKLKHYAMIRVTYYVIYDPDHYLSRQTLRVFMLQGGTYRPLTEPFFLSQVGLGLKLWEGEYQDLRTVWLRWCDRNGKLIPTGEEKTAQERRRAEKEKQKAQQAKQRADQLEAQASQERQRAERLAAKLRKLGIDPEAA